MKKHTWKVWLIWLGRGPQTWSDGTPIIYKSAAQARRYAGKKKIVPAILETK